MINNSKGKIFINGVDMGGCSTVWVDEFSDVTDEQIDFVKQRTGLGGLGKIDGDIELCDIGKHVHKNPFSNLKSGDYFFAFDEGKDVSNISEIGYSDGETNSVWQSVYFETPVTLLYGEDNHAEILNDAIDKGYKCKPYKRKDSGWKEEALHLAKDGLSWRKIAKRLNVPRSTISDYLRGEIKGYVKPKDKAKVNLLKEPKILFFDIETSPQVSYHWRNWDENISPIQTIKHSQLLTVSYAFNNEEVVGDKLSVDDVQYEDDLTLLVNIIDAINKADVVVTFNGKRFDLKYLNTRALYYGLPPIKPVKHIDLMEQAKKTFKFPSNSLDNILNYLGMSGKKKHSGFDLWKRCMETSNVEACSEALDEMLKYNIQDVEITRKLYYRLQGWFKQTPNLGVLSNSLNDTSELRCSKCGSDDVSEIDGGMTFTTANTFKLYRCGSCRGVSRITSGNKQKLVGVV